MAYRSFLTPPTAIAALLAETIAPTTWNISRPLLGQQKEGYIARSATQTVFLKFDTAPGAILQRLSDLGVTPRLLAHGELNGRSYVIQDYVAGTHPATWRWFEAHLLELSALTQRYQNDIALRQLLAAAAPKQIYREHIAATPCSA